MAFHRIVSYQILVGPGGGDIQGKLDNGKAFREGVHPYPTFIALAAVVNGPNPGYDPDNRSFICMKSINDFNDLTAFSDSKVFENEAEKG